MTLTSQTALDDRPVELPPAPSRGRARWVGAAAVAVAVLLGLLLSRPPSTSSTATTSSSGGTAEKGTAQPAGRPDVGTAPSLGKLSGSAPGLSDGARVVKEGTVDLVVRGTQVGPTVTAVQAVVVAARGYAADSSTTESGSRPVATTTYRVPVGAFERVLAQVRQVAGARVTGTTTSGTDVTGTYADTQAQVQSLTAARERFLTILSRARTIAETLSVQQRVDEVQQQIDQLESRRRVLAATSDLATLTVSVSTGVSPERRTAGLRAAWDRACHGFASGVEALVAHSGRAALVLLIAGVLLGLARLGRRVLRRH